MLWFFCGRILIGKIEANTDEIPWEEIEEESKVNETIDKVDEEVKEDFIEEKVL